MKRFFITHILPREFELKYKLSVAASNFSRNLMDGGTFDGYYSIMPTYVQAPLEEVKMPELVYSKYRTKGRLWSKFAILHENWMVFRRLPKECSVWMYNMTSLTLPLYFMLKWFRPRSKRNVIILDYTPNSGLLSKICRWAFNHADGTIVLSSSPLFTVKNTVCLPGVTPREKVCAPYQVIPNYEFLLSGVLNEKIAMVSMVLEAFSRIPEATLHITGFLDDEAIVQRYCSYPNIHYHGKLEYEDYLRVFHQATFQLSTRDPESPENLCNFPSKVLEALLHNRIVISTIHYPQLDGVRYLEVPSDLNGFTESVRSIIGQSKERLLAYANQSEVVRRKFNTDVWDKAMETIEKRV